MHHYIFLIDTSYSMYTYTSKVRQIISEYIQNIKENIHEIAFISIVTFNSELTYIVRNMPVEQVYQIPDFNVNSNTCLYDAVSTVISEYVNDTETVYNMYIISDGDDTGSRYYSKESTDTLCKQVIDTGKWHIIHYNTQSPNIIPVQYVKIDMNNLDVILNGLTL